MAGTWRGTCGGAQGLRRSRRDELDVVAAQLGTETVALDRDILKLAGTLREQIGSRSVLVRDPSL